MNLGEYEASLIYIVSFRIRQSYIIKRLCLKQTNQTTNQSTYCSYGVPILGGSQLPVTLVPRETNASGFRGYLNCYAHTHTQIHIHTIKIIIIIQLQRF